jgi:hypothetical protein
MSTGIAFVSFKKISFAFFLNICFANTEPKEVPFETTGGECEELSEFINQKIK